MTAVASARRPPVAVGVALIVVGALVVVGTLGVTAIQWARSLPVSTSTRTIDLSDQGVSQLRVDASGVDLSVEYGPGTAASLTASGQGGAQAWTFQRNGDLLTVTSPTRSGVDSPWFGSEKASADLTLPYSTEGVDYDAHITASAGETRISGDYRGLTVKQSAGDVDLAASAQTLDVELSAGEFTGSVVGDQPDSVRVDLSAGDLALTLPQGDYAVSSDVSAGEFTDHLPIDSGSPSRVQVTVSAGSATIGAGG